MSFKYKNYTNREVTLYIGNSIPIHFNAKEVKTTDFPDLEKKYRNYIILLPEEKSLTEATSHTKPVKKGTLISEVKQPADNKEQIAEPITEESKKQIFLDRMAAGKAKVRDGYTTTLSEVTIATSK